MERKEKLTNLYLCLLLPCGVAATTWAIVRFPFENIGVGLIGVAFVTVFLSSNLRFQLPRTKMYVTTSDALIFLSMFLYGGPVAVLLAALEMTFNSWNLRSRGVPMKVKTTLINIAIAAFSVFAASVAVSLAVGPAENIVKDTGSAQFVSLLAITALSQFIVNSLCVAVIVAIKTEMPVWKVWNESCLNTLVMFVSAAVMAGFGVIALEQINVFLFVAVILFFAVVCFTYQRYVDDIRQTSARAEQAERDRAEEAERHVRELELYVDELVKSGAALGESREKFRHAAFHDALTGLPNRNHFVDALSTLAEKSGSGSKLKFAVLFLDLNRFKTINDSLGHSTGDGLIKQVAWRLTKLMKPGQVVGRFSGDEFAILLTEIENEAEVTSLADEAAKRLAEPFWLDDRRVFTTVSIGIAFGNEDYAQAEEILRDADIAMYYAKEKQKDFVIFDQNMHARAVTLLQLDTDLRFAVERNELELFYQPIINLSETKLSGFEALVRWKHPKRGLIMPNEFIPVSEDTGLIVPMTLQILRRACSQLVDWQKRFPSDEPMTVAVNVSGKHFAHNELVGQIRTILRETGITPECLKLEITESAVMENAENAIIILRQIRELGVQLCIDDFGTGHSSLSYLQRFPIDTLKVDRSFVSAMEDGSENGEIVRTIVALAKILKLNVVAEGIESIHQIQLLRVLGCEYGQGYLFSRPLPVEEIEKILGDTFRWRNLLSIPEYGTITQNPDYAQLRQLP